MADISPIITTLGVFPQVIDAAEKYKTAEPDLESRGIARGIANENAQFEQTTQRLQYPTQLSSSHDYNFVVSQLEANFGAKSTAQILDDLNTLTAQLHSLKAELVNTGRGKEVLDKIRGKIPTLVSSSDKKPRTRLQVRLDAISKTNQLLATRLSFGRTQLSHEFWLPNVSSVCQRIAEFSQRATISFNLLNQKYTCHCQESHIVYLQCPDITVSPVADHLSASDSAQPLDFIIQPRENTTQQDRLCSFIAGQDKQYSASSVLPLQDWMRLHGPDLDRKRRIELSLQLSLAVLQLSSTPWIDQSWTWDDWRIIPDSLPHRLEGRLLFRRKFGSSAAQREHLSATPTALSILSREPVLSKLGLCLIELAYGQTLSEIRRERLGKNDACYGDDALDCDSIGFIAAKQLLTSQRIRIQIGEEFEHAVRACILQQFRSGKNADLTELDHKDPLFLHNATVSIISPLQSQVEKHIRSTHRGAAPVNRASSKLLSSREPVDHQAFMQSSTPGVLTQTRTESLGDGPGSVDTQTLSSRMDQGNREAAQSRLRHLQTDQRASASSQALPPAVSVEASIESLNSSASKSDEIRRAEVERSRQPQQDPAAQPGIEVQGPRPPSPSEQSLEESEWVFGSVTETINSKQAWAADVLDAPPEMASRPLNPFLSRIKHLVLRVILHQFHACEERRHGMGSETGGSSAPQRVRRPGKRARAQSDQGDTPDEYAEEDDESRENEGHKRPQAGTEDGDSNSLTLACPFFKKDPRQYGSCSGKKLSRIRDVKQHLSRRHSMPIYCAICYQTFSDEVSRDAHTAEMRCQRGSVPQPEGINQRQQTELRKRVPRQLSTKEQWDGIFKLLFPGHQLPSTPYINANHFASAMAYQEFVMTQGVDILNNTLTQSGTITWHVPPGSHRDDFQRQILREGLEAISDAWRSQDEIPADIDAASSSSIVQTGTQSSIGESSGYAPSHSVSETWSFDNHQHHMFNNFHGMTMGSIERILGDDMGEIQNLVSEAEASDIYLGWQHGGYTDNQNNSYMSRQR